MHNAAIAIIKDEHQTLSTVVEALQLVVRAMRVGWAQADFALLSAMLYYIDTFARRYHHPKEEDYLFKLLRMRTSAANGVIEELQAEHVQSGQMMASLAKLLVHYQGGSPGGLDEFSSAVDAYAALLSSHLQKEEMQIIPIAIDHLIAADWETISAAFQANLDPLFGDQATREFRRLRQRILNLAPRKIRMPRERDAGC
ncbi:MAG: hypothetical protein A3G24_13010 [Betaproteobacteria bacterium RIFCSPLOWO2_12_FULL_62_13]|nr:MAG: hypothetical protein A3G24_13010 [Betaproteobacteria bacterium RIFCSPLOWO2_12_FULL_62_13]